MVLTGFIEHKGRTIHLLKSASKSVPADRKRRKIAIQGSLQQFQQAAGQQMAEEPAADIAMDKGEEVPGTPNIHSKRVRKAP